MHTSSLALVLAVASITPGVTSAAPGALGPTERAVARQPTEQEQEAVLGADREVEDGPLFAVSLDGGLPSGMAVDVAIGPLDFMRLSAGLTYNLASLGFRAGADLVPFHGVVRPVLTFRLGHAFDGDASRLASLLGVPAGQAELLRHVSYDYASAQLGLEVGSETGFSAFAGAGVAWISSTSPGAAALFRTWTPSTAEAPGQAQVHATMPAVNFGIMQAF